MFDISHLVPPRADGWGYLPNSQEIYNILHTIKDDLNPKQILEIGFNAGHSSTYLLDTYTDATVTAIGPSPKGDNEKTLQQKYGNRFVFLLGRTDEVYDQIVALEAAGQTSPYALQPHTFDFAFIDGHHNMPWVFWDVWFCTQHLHIPYILMDNTDQPQVREVAERIMCLRNVKDWEYFNTWKNVRKQNKLSLYKF